MKKLLLIVLAAALVILLAACGGKDSAQPENSASPDGPGDEYTYPDAPTLETSGAFAYPSVPAATVAANAGAPADPENTSAWLSDPSATSGAAVPGIPGAGSLGGITGYSTITSESLSLSMQYPTGWINKPGRYTICFQQDTDDEFPARVSVTVKSLKHTPEKKSEIQEEFRSYFTSIAEMYEKGDFTVGDLEEEGVTFMGQSAIASTYVTTYGKTEVKGYCVITNVGRKLCVFHFCCPYDDYAAAEAIRGALRDSVRFVTK